MHNILSAQLPDFKSNHPWEASPAIRQRTNELIGKGWKPDLFSNIEPEQFFNGNFKNVKTFDEHGRPLNDVYQSMFNGERFHPEAFNHEAYLNYPILKSPKGDKIMYTGVDKELPLNNVSTSRVINVAKLRKLS